MKPKIVSTLWHSLYNLLMQLKYKQLTLGHSVKIVNSTFGHHVYIGDRTTIYRSHLDACSYVGENSFINLTNIGKFCSIGPRVMMGMGNHPTRTFVTTSAYFYAPKGAKPFNCFADKLYFEQEHQPIAIGHDVWVGAGALLMDGVTVGHGAIIGAGAVLTKDALPYGIYGGVPAKFIKFRFPDEDIAFLLQAQWWNRPMTWLRENYCLLHDIQTFKSNT
ncbi:MAG: CatB-related O-acetyltransferase [Prevotellaceae bacterium]|nr:CatB-related O-acetyltransferase [Prevotellaceae bacterium]